MRGTLDRYLLKESATSMTAVISVLLLIMLSTQFSRLLGDAAKGEIPKDILFKAVSLTALQYLGALMPVALLLSIMLALGRLYKDNEVAAMTGCGVSLLHMYRPFLLLGAIVALLVGILSLEVGPWAGRVLEQVSKEARRVVQYTPFESGRFKDVAGGRAVFYTEKIDNSGENMQMIFARIEQPGSAKVPSGDEMILVAREGHQQLDPSTGDRTVSLDEGMQYSGIPGQSRFDIVHFGKFVTHVTPPPLVIEVPRRRAKTTEQLLSSGDVKDLAEWQWRLSAPISVLLMALLAVPLAHVRPRQGRYGKLVWGLVIYLLYSNLIGVGQNWIEKGRLSPHIGLWWIHAVVLSGTLMLLWKRIGGLRGLRG